MVEKFENEAIDGTPLSFISYNHLCRRSSGPVCRDLSVKTPHVKKIPSPLPFQRPTECVKIGVESPILHREEGIFNSSLV